MDEAPAGLHLFDLPDDEPYAPVEERSLRPAQVVGPLAAHGDVHEARLVDVVTGRIDDGDLDLAGVDPPAQPLDQEIGGEGAPDPATQDQDAAHGGPTVASRR